MNENFNDEISLRQIAYKVKFICGYLLSKWKLLLLVGGIAGGLGFLNASSKKPVFTASISFVLEDEKAGGGGLSGALGLASQFGLDMGSGVGSMFGSSNLIELMKSRNLVEKTLLSPITLNNNIISFADFYIQFSGFRNKWNSIPRLKNISFLPNSDRAGFSLQQDSILGIIYNNLIVHNLTISQKDKKVSIINLNVVCTNEIFSKSFAESLVNEVSEFYIETKSKRSKISVSMLEKQTDSIRRELNSAMNGVAIANDNTYNLNPALNLKRVPSLRRQVDVQANTAILTELVKNLELARMTLRRETPLIQVIDRPILPLKKVKSSRLFQTTIWGVVGIVIVALLLLVALWWRNLMSKG